MIQWASDHVRAEATTIVKKPPTPTFFDIVYTAARLVPPGRVTSYGAIARALGHPLKAREVGWALAMLPHEHDVPAHRVVGARGDLRCKYGFRVPGGQRGLLESEGVEFDRYGRVRMDAFSWEPPDLLPD